MKLQNSGFLSLDQVQNRYLNGTGPGNGQTSLQSSASFRKYLQQAEESAKVSSALKMSKHAAGRLSSRNIELTPGQMERLNEGTKRAEEKGINESLVLIDSLAFIVNVPSKTVVTAMDQTETRENIFTNIDGAVIM